MYRLFPFVNLFYLSAPEPESGRGEFFSSILQSLAYFREAGVANFSLFF